MNLIEYIKLIYEARQPSENVRAARDMNDDELAEYLETLFPDIKTIIQSQPGLYQYLLRSRKDVLEKLKSKRAKGLDYYKDVISKYTTLQDLKVDYPNMYSILYSRYGKDVANELLSGLERGKRGRRVSEPKTIEPTTQITEPENPYLKLQDLGQTLSQYSSFDEFRIKNAKLLIDLNNELGSEQFADIMNDLERKFLENQPLSIDKVRQIVGNYEFLGDFRKENPKLFIDMKKTFSKEVVDDLLGGLKKGTSQIKREKFDIPTARRIISQYTDLDTFTVQRSDVAQNIRKYFGSNGFYELTKGLRRNRKVIDPKEKLPLTSVSRILQNYSNYNELKQNEPDFVELALKIYGSKGFQKMVENKYGIEPSKVDSVPRISKGTSGKIATAQIRQFLQSYPTKEKLKSEKPAIYDALEELGVIKSYYGN